MGQYKSAVDCHHQLLIDLGSEVLNQPSCRRQDLPLITLVQGATIG